jgi:hypothetical protein
VLLHRARFPNLPFVAVPLGSIVIDLVPESVRVQDRRLPQEPFVAKNVKFNLGLPVAPAGDCV